MTKIKYKGYLIERNEDGYYCEALELGYNDTLASIELDIEDEIAAERRDLYASGHMDDTPSLPAPWWHDR